MHAHLASRGQTPRSFARRLTLATVFSPHLAMACLRGVVIALLLILLSCPAPTVQPIEAMGGECDFSQHCSSY